MLPDAVQPRTHFGNGGGPFARSFCHFGPEFALGGRVCLSQMHLFRR